MKITYIVVGLVILAAIVAAIYVLSQPRGATPVGSLGAGTVGGNTQALVSTAGTGLTQFATAIAGAASS